MENWKDDGHLTDWALELRAAGELDDGADDLEAIEKHIVQCDACARREAGWQRLFQALAVLPPLEPSDLFDRRVLARVRRPPTAAPGRFGRYVRGLRHAAAAAAVVWAGSVAAAAAWLAGRTEIAAAAIDGGVSALGELFWAALVRGATLVEISGLPEAWARAQSAVPGPSILAALALMTALSAVALWTLYRVTVSEPSRPDAHA